MLLSILVLALKTGIIRPSLLPVTMLHVLIPVALVLNAISLLEFSKTVRSIIFPLACIDVTVHLDEPTPAVCFVCLKVTFIEGSVRFE